MGTDFHLFCFDVFLKLNDPPIFRNHSLTNYNIFFSLWPIKADTIAKAVTPLKIFILHMLLC
ncbi:hypothetical protein CEV08_05495 [Bartonella tribocorum]|uniref:Uncharacterized protein n=1 Tax=Bartonella tribocorum TaxID=85701 RepID=A0A2M6UU68_9HYPH|nr:hypothetical protein CEV08_05495 [Bartonella tribocorum]